MSPTSAFRSVPVTITGVLCERGRGEQIRCQFKHALIQDAAYVTDEEATATVSPADLALQEFDSGQQTAHATIRGVFIDRTAQ